MKVQALFYIQSVKDIVVAGGSHNIEVEMYPVTRQTDDNKQWSKYTPSGSIKLMVTEEGGQQFFRDNIGKDVPILFG
jgi:hypothetical protein